MAGKQKPSVVLNRQIMSDKDFEKFSKFVYQNVGIKLPPGKKTMIEARLQKRLRAGNFTSHKQYLEYLFSQAGLKNELVSLIDTVTTNTTDFFREPKHFEFLINTLLPAWMDGPNRSKVLKIWSAGCSIGMEPYTLAMVLTDFKDKNPGFKFSLLATDISTDALKKAVRAVYDEERVQPVPQPMKKKFLLRSRDRDKRLVRVVPELRKLVEFKRLNFMEDFSFLETMNIIFCRNVVIYFDKSTQEVLFNKFCRQIAPGGNLFIGHSESLAGMDLPLRQLIPTVYQRV